MRRKRRSDLQVFDSDSFDEYEDELDGDLSDLGNFSKDFYSTDWEDPSGSERRFSTRRKIERRNDLKELDSQFDDWDDFDLTTEW
ncbi:hypothetical protein ACFL3I_05650 [Pseudomonadota bacterium]